MSVLQRIPARVVTAVVAICPFCHAEVMVAVAGKLIAPCEHVVTASIVPPEISFSATGE